MLNLTSTVGIAGDNQHADVRLVQTLIGLVPSELGGTKLVVDGNCGSATEAAIQAFQLHWFGWRLADGRVDPAGATLAWLLDLLGQSDDLPNVSELAEMEPLTGPVEADVADEEALHDGSGLPTPPPSSPWYSAQELAQSAASGGASEYFNTDHPSLLLSDFSPTSGMLRQSHRAALRAVTADLELGNYYFRRARIKSPVSGTEDTFEALTEHDANGPLGEAARWRARSTASWLSSWGTWRLRDKPTSTGDPNTDPPGSDDAILRPLRRSVTVQFERLPHKVDLESTPSSRWSLELQHSLALVPGLGILTAQFLLTNRDTGRSWYAAYRGEAHQYSIAYSLDPGTRVDFTTSVPVPVDAFAKARVYIYSLSAGIGGLGAGVTYLQMSHMFSYSANPLNPVEAVTLTPKFLDFSGLSVGVSLGPSGFSSAGRFMLVPTPQA